MLINFKTKKMQHFWNNYKSALRRDIATLQDVYKNPSARKIKVYEQCVRTFHDLNGRDFAIISSNRSVFTVAFIYREDGKEWFLVKTSADQYIISEIKED